MTDLFLFYVSVVSWLTQSSSETCVHFLVSVGAVQCVSFSLYTFLIVFAYSEVCGSCIFFWVCWNHETR